MMQGYGLVLARAGYTVHAFDFLGHGRHPMPMTGDVESLSGTTQRLVDQTLAVLDSIESGEPVALLGHSMATDVLVRVAEARPVGPVVLLSAFSNAITPEHPRDMLIVTGAWEPGLRDFALEAARMVDPGASSGETVRDGAVRRQALIAPLVEHVAILHSRAGRQAALDWLNGHYDRARPAGTPPTGWALLALMGAITALFAPLARLLPRKAPEPPGPMPAGRFAAVTLLPAVAVPLIAAPLDTAFMPVLVADYLALHLALFGCLQLALLGWLRGLAGFAWPRPAMAALLLAWGLGVFGFALDRYGANFWPVGPRVPIIAALCAGAVPFMLADAALARGARLWQRIAARVAFLASLGAAVALDVEGLFFLVMIAPVIVLFWLTLGTMGRVAARRAGPATAGLALGVILAWALGVSFPLFAA
jgi:hypothetical protein